MDKLTKLFVLVGLLVFLVAPVGCTPQTEVRITSSSDVTPSDLYVNIALPTVLVMGEEGTGSGVVYGGGRFVLTAAHVISKAEMLPDGSIAYKAGSAVVMTNMTPDVFVSPTEVLSFDEKLDLAILKLSKTWAYSAKITDDSELTLYETAYIAGHPHGVTDVMVTEGRIQDLWDDGYLRYSAPTTFGNSGGPVFVRRGNGFVVVSIVQRVHVEGFNTAVNHLGLGALPRNIMEFTR